MSDSDSFIRLKKELKTLFRSEDKDLNFGIYRIMNQKNEVIEKFIDSELPWIVQTKISELKENLQKDIDSEIEKLKRNLESAGVDPKSSPKFNELLDRKKDNLSLTDIEDNIYNHIVNFFSRYYQDGDFITKFFFKENAYYLPYDGSEVDLYWATKDMYYVKSSEQFKRFSFDYGKIKRILINFGSVPAID